MGGVLSEEGLPLPVQQQQQRAQLLLLSQLREARGLDPFGMGDREEQSQPTEQPVLRHTPVYKNPHHVKGKTIRLSPKQLTPEGKCMGTEWELVFNYDATIPCEVLLHLDNGPLLVDGDAEAAAGRVACSWSSTPRACQASMQQEQSIEFDLVSLLPEAEADTSFCLAFCLELRACSNSTEDGARDQGGTDTRTVERTLGRLVAGLGPLPEVEVGGQQVHLPGIGQETYESREIFGGESHDPAVLGQDCVICMSEPRDTAVMPCRHMCLCGSCAETMRSRVQYRSYRCPICRERVASLQQLLRPEAKKIEEPQAAAQPGMDSSGTAPPQAPPQSAL